MDGQFSQQSSREYLGLGEGLQFPSLSPTCRCEIGRQQSSSPAPTQITSLRDTFSLMFIDQVFCGRCVQWVDT